MRRQRKSHVDTIGAARAADAILWQKPQVEDVVAEKSDGDVHVGEGVVRCDVIELHTEIQLVKARRQHWIEHDQPLRP